MPPSLTGPQHTAVLPSDSQKNHTHSPQDGEYGQTGVPLGSSLDSSCRWNLHVSLDKTSEGTSYSPTCKSSQGSVYLLASSSTWLPVSLWMPLLLSFTCPHCTLTCILYSYFLWSLCVFIGLWGLSDSSESCSSLGFYLSFLVVVLCGDSGRSFPWSP